MIPDKHSTFMALIILFENLVKARKIFDQETLLTLYHAFVYPHLNYFIHVWDKAYNVQVHDLTVLQNEVVYLVHGVSPKQVKNAEKIYFDSNTLSLKCLYSYDIGILMYRFSKNMLPELFEIAFSNITTMHYHNTRSVYLNHINIKYKWTTRGQRESL